MKRLILGLVILIAGASYAQSQAPVVTQPYKVTSQNYSSTIVSTNTFQNVWNANVVGRSGCTIQNNGTNSMYVYFGDIADATLAKSVKLSVGQSVNCNVGGVVLQDQVSITGTSGEAFYASQY